MYDIITWSHALKSPSNLPWPVKHLLWVTSSSSCSWVNVHWRHKIPVQTLQNALSLLHGHGGALHHCCWFHPSSHSNLSPHPLPNPTSAILGRIQQNCTNTSSLLTLFPLIWWLPSRAPCKQTWMVVISEAAHTLCDLAPSLELCFATSLMNYIRKPHMLSDVMQYLLRVIIVWRSQIQNWWVSIAGEAKPCSELHPASHVYNGAPSEQKFA